MKNPTGYTLYEGPSVLNGEPIVAVLVIHSKNAKTGNMMQTYIMDARDNPVETSWLGRDESVCGLCPARHSLDGHCYVVLGHGPQMVWKAWQRGRYPSITRRHLRKLQGRALRLGTYGDPAAVPFRVWKPLVDISGTHTGYTHQLHHPHFDDRLLQVCMVSTEDDRSSQALQTRGVRTFRAKHPEDPLLDGEILCPYESATDIQCIDCGLCSGSDSKAPSIAIDVHGTWAHRFAGNLIAKEAA